MSVHKKAWGRETHVVNCNKYCLKILELNEGYRCSMHYHKRKDETFYILSGKVRMEVCKENNGSFTTSDEVMYPGSYIRIKPKTLHRFTGIEDSVIIEVSTRHFEEDSHRVIRSGKVEDDI